VHRRFGFSEPCQEFAEQDIFVLMNEDDFLFFGFDADGEDTMLCGRETRSFDVQTDWVRLQPPPPEYDEGFRPLSKIMVLIEPFLALDSGTEPVPAK
jgi:hypothetical protein